MADKEIDVQIKATTGGMGAGINDAKNKINSLGDGVSSLVDNFKGIAASIGVAFAVDKIDDFARSMSELGEQIERTSKMTGLSSDEVQKFQFAVKMTGGDSDNAAMSLLRLERNMADAAAGSKDAQAKFAAAGVSMKTLASGDVNAILGEIADTFSKTADGANKTALAMGLAGRGGASLIPILDQGRAGLQAFNSTQDATNSKLTQAQVDGFAKTAQQIKIMDAATVGVSEQIMTRLNPGIDGAITGLTLMKESLSENIKKGGTFATVVDALGTAIEGTVKFIMYASTGFKEMWDVGKGALDALKDEWIGFGKTVLDVAGGHLTKAVDDFDAAQAKALDDFKAGLIAAQTETVKLTDDILKMDAAAKKGIIPAGGKPKDKKDKPQIKLPDKSDTKDTEDYSGERALLAEQYATKKETDDLMVESGRISHRQELADLDSALRDQQALTDASFQQEMDEYEGSESGYQKLINQKELADKKFANDHTKLMIEQTKDDQKVWTTVFDTIGHSFDTMVTGILQGTQTIQSAFLRMAGNLILAMVNATIKMALDWIKGEAMQVQATAAAETAKVAAKTTGAAEGVAAQKSAVSSSILKDAEGAAAGVYNSVAQIPYIGWLLAPPAAAAAFSAVAAYDSFDVGTPNVPRDMLAQIHQGEAIVPAKTAEKWRDGDLGTGGNQIHFHVNAMDSKSVKQFFNQHGSTIAKTLSGQVRGGNRSFAQHF